jgi:hypothetical protein
MAIPDLALRLRCSKCGSRKIKMMINVTELYAWTRGTSLLASGSKPHPACRRGPRFEALRLEADAGASAPPRLAPSTRCRIQHLS